ncbi:unnamed protein product [Effrenium voratum]|nr:unnamed protein product [Effrenium voratum]
MTAGSPEENTARLVLNGLEANAASPTSKDDTKSMMSPPPGYKMRRQFLAFVAILAYVMSGLTIVVVNKCIVRDSGLHAPALVSSMGALFTAAMTRFLVFIGKVEVRDIDLTPLEFAIWRAFPVGVLAAGSLCFGNMSYIYLDAGFIQMLKAGTPALLLFVLSMFKIEKISPLGAALSLTMVGGSALATLQQPNINTLGHDLRWLRIVSCRTARHDVAVDTQKEKHQRQKRSGTGRFESAAVSQPEMVVNLSSLLVIKYTSSLLAKLLVIVRCSALVLFFMAMGEEFTWLQVVGYIVTIIAFTGYSTLKATEMDEKEDEEFLKIANLEEGGRELLMQEEDRTPTTPMQKVIATDLTSFFFWFALLIVVVGGYQAYVLGEIERNGYLASTSELALAASDGVPPAPYLQVEAAAQEGHLAPLPSVQSSAKVLFLKDGRFLLHSRDAAWMARRSEEDYLSSAWLVVSSQFGTVQLKALDGHSARGSWLSCHFKLSSSMSEACSFWMTPKDFESWAQDGDHQEFILRGSQSGANSSVAVRSSHLEWDKEPTSFFVADWVPESCALRPMPATAARYDAQKEVTVTMTTRLHNYARNIKFRQAFSSALAHLKEGDFYVREYLVVDEWFQGRSLAMNGTLAGPTVRESRHEMLSFFPGCIGASTVEASKRPAGQRCTFVFKSAEEQGKARSLNILLDLMVTKYWLHLDIDTVFHQDFYMSRLLQPIYDQKERCAAAIAAAQTSTETSTSTRTTRTTTLPVTTIAPYTTSSQPAPAAVPEDATAWASDGYDQAYPEDETRYDYAPEGVESSGLYLQGSLYPVIGLLLNLT